MDSTTLQTLLRSIEAKDRCTAAHTWRVVLYTRAAAERAGLDSGFIAQLTNAAALHDIGKIEIPEAILNKPTPLTPGEYEIMKSHTVRGYELLTGMGETDEVMLALVRHHHERWDGKGYPDGLAGDAIPLAARYFAVIDSFDAMTGNRPYRPILNDEQLEEAIGQLRDGMGTQFDPAAVETFLDLFATGDLDWILHYFNDESPVPDYDPIMAAQASEAGGPTAELTAAGLIRRSAEDFRS